MRFLALLMGSALLAETNGPLAVLREPAPELTGKGWLNVTGQPPVLKVRRGQVTVVHFWTYGCVNCRRNLPVYERWSERFAADQVAVIGIHTPEFEAEARPENVTRRVKELGITYPVLLDPDQLNWRRWNQQYWPAIYLIDREGRVRYRWAGELNFGRLDGERRMTSLIQELIQEKP